MKKNILSICVLLISINILFWPSPYCDAGGSLVGGIDMIDNGGNILGWALDSGAQTKTIDVHFYLDGPDGAGGGTFLGAATANLSRSDLNAAGVSGDHGYSFAMPATYKDGKQHTLYAYAIDNVANPQLSNSPRIFVINSCAANKVCLNFLFGKQETVFDWASEHCSGPDQYQIVADKKAGDTSPWLKDYKMMMPDSSVFAFKDSQNQVQLFLPSYINSKASGGSLDNVKHDCNVTMESDLDPDPSHFNDYEWLTSGYTLNGKDVYSLIHNEYHGAEYPGLCQAGDYLSCWYNSVSVAVSHDGGKSFTHAAAPTHTVLFPLTKQAADSAGPYGYFGPSHIIKGNDGFFYSYVWVSPYLRFNVGTDGNIIKTSTYNAAPSQLMGVCIMRTDNIRELTDGGTTDWRLWDGTGFNIKSKNPYAENFDPNSLACKVIYIPTYGNITWNTYLKKYIAVGNWLQTNKDAGYPVAYSLSDDLINWTPGQPLLDIKDGYSWSYGSIIDPQALENGTDTQTRNFEKSDNNFYIYRTREKAANGLTGDITAWDLVRFPVAVTTYNADPAGSFDYAGCDYATGWACDVDDYSKPLAVHFYLDGEYAKGGTWLGYIPTANVMREAGVANSCGGYANHGFKYNLPDSVKDGKPHTLYMYAINVPDGANPLLGSKTITCDATHVCAANAVDGCRVCKSDGSAWVDTDSKCLNGQTCSGGKCVSTSACAPNCSNKVCGQDGCGGSCGACGSGKACNGGVCAAQSPAAPMVSANPSNPSTPLISSNPTNDSNTSSSSNPISTKPVAKMTRAQILAAIAKIQALIADLQKQLASMTGFSCTTITKNLFYGMTNDPQVKCLQEVLKSQGYAVSASGNYDAATKTAVALFQQKYAGEILAPYHLTRGSGNVGNATLAKVNHLIKGN